MKLREYLKLTKEKPYRFADRAKVRRAIVYALAEDNDQAPPLMLNRTMQRIVEASGGAVHLEDLQ